MQTITFLNQKGGVGKSSCTHHLGGTFALMGKRVLLVDADPQSSLTQGLLGPDALDTLDPDVTIAGVLNGHDPFPTRVVHKTGIPRLDLMPGSSEAHEANVYRPWLTDYTVQSRLKRTLAELDYDVCLIDCPPTFYGCSWAALVAADALVVPLQPEDYGAQGIRAVQDCIEEVRSGSNPGLQLAGYLITMVNPRLSIHQAYEESLRAAYGEQVFRIKIPYATDFKEAIAARQPIGVYKPKGASAKIIKGLAEETLARLDREVSYGQAG